MKQFITCLLFLPALCLANTLTLINDSPFTLTATIYDATGNMLGEISLDRGSTGEWSDSVGFNTEDVPMSMTPYIVNWYCMNGDPFSTCSEVPAGSTTAALSCVGAQECGASNDSPTSE